MKFKPSLSSDIKYVARCTILLLCFYFASYTQQVLAAAAFANQPLAEKKMLQQTRAQVYEKVLANGLKIIVKPDHRAPIVVVEIWYKVGSANEASGLTGISHALEHMMQKSMKAHCSRALSHSLLPGIGESNAFTSRDYTSYYHLIEKNRLQDIFRLEACRMGDLKIHADDFAIEKQVIVEERQQYTEDIPEATLYQEFNALAYNISGYRHPTIGWLTDIFNLQSNDLILWHQQNYTPDNATIVVVGDVEPEEVFSLARKEFSHLTAAHNPKLKVTQETPQKGIKRIIMTSKDNLTLLIAGFQIPSLVSADKKWHAYALELLASLLGSGDNSRLSRNLIRHSKVAAQISVEYTLYAQNQTQFIIKGIPNKGFSVRDLQQAIFAEIEHLKNELVSEQELTRVKTQILAAEVFDQDSILYQAKMLGIAESIGIGWKNDENYIRHILSITPEQLQQVAQQYFIPSTITIAVLKPVDKTAMPFRGNDILHSE